MLQINFRMKWTSFVYFLKTTKQYHYEKNHFITVNMS